MYTSKLSKLLLLPVIILIAATISCATDNGSVLIGKWDYQSISIQGQETDMGFGDVPTLEFKADKQFVSQVGEISRKGSWELVNDTITFTDQDKKVHKLIIESATEEKVVLIAHNPNIDIDTKIILVPTKD